MLQILYSIFERLLNKEDFERSLYRQSAALERLFLLEISHAREAVRMMLRLERESEMAAASFRLLNFKISEAILANDGAHERFRSRLTESHFSLESEGDTEGFEMDTPIDLLEKIVLRVRSLNGVYILVEATTDQIDERGRISFARVAVRLRNLETLLTALLKGFSCRKE